MTKRTVRPTRADRHPTDDLTPATAKAERSRAAGAKAARKAGDKAETAAATGKAATRPSAPRRGPTHRRAIDAQPSVEQIVRVSTIATGVFVVAATASALRPEWFAALGVSVSIVLFFVGCAAFIVGYARAVPRSRVDELDLPGLFFLVNSVDKATQRRLVALLVIQIIVGVAAASARPFTPVAFCTLTPVFGLGALGLCGATHGRFFPRRP